MGAIGSRTYLYLYYISSPLLASMSWNPTNAVGDRAEKWAI